MSLACAKSAAVLSVVFAGLNAWQLMARHEDVREKARMFSELAAEEGAGARLILVRSLFYIVAPLIYLWFMGCAGLPKVFLGAAIVKFWLSAHLGLRTERRILRGEEYAERDHVVARADAAANIALAAGVVWLILMRWT